MDFSQETLARIESAVHWVERQINGKIQHAGDAFGRTYEDRDELQVFKLTSTLAQGSSALGNPWQWSASGASYSADTGSSYVIKDTLNKFTGSSGDLVLCRYLGDSDNVTIREVLAVLSGGCRLFLAQTNAAVGSGDTNFVVSGISAADMGSALVSSSSQSIIVSNWAGWTANAGNKCMFSLTDLTASSNSIGHGKFVQGVCGSSS